MNVLRTADQRFAGLPGYPYAPHYVEVPGGSVAARLRMHYLDEGPATAAPVLLLHGEPSWSYLYRRLVAPLVAAGQRVVAPDLIGFGRSDKPTQLAHYSYQSHMDWMQAFVQALDLRNITLVCQDWGGLIGLRLLAEAPERFARVVAANTFLPTGDQPPGEAFLAWRKFSQEVPVFPVGGIVARGCTKPLTDAIQAAYDAPFPDETYKAGARAFPLLVPVTPNDPAAAANRRAWQVLGTLKLPFLTAFSDGDPITRGADAILQKRIPGAAGQPHVTIPGGGHFLQEDCGEALAAVVVDFIARSAGDADPASPGTDAATRIASSC
ncbi:MAG: haloalkane dehalogenase [Lysobacterales bacterium CG02_land_8_20_14_3_00_62_12]|nr:MAG: haloalkane dehalogenase [Xanthomonadales bacterium CG02_land_8_20_14_3_00_62_12]